MSTFLLIQELGYEYVMAGHFPKWHAMLLDTWQDYSATRCAYDLEEAVAEVSRRTRKVVVENSWKAFRKRLLRKAPDLGLNPLNI